MKYTLQLLFLILFTNSIFAQEEGYKALPPTNFEDVTPPPAPDYSNTNNWAALPSKEDSADLCPGDLQHNQDNAAVDIFFVHPTIYTGSQEGQDQWNADINDATHNADVDDSTIKNQASCFNAAGRVYAPRYRQAHIYAYYTKNKEAGDKALDLAYQDVKQAFEYYLEHYNEGRPFIIASHSQGTTHSGHLLLDFVDNQPLQEQLVAAYLVGIPIPKDTFQTIPVCKTPDQTGCFCAWRTWRNGKYPEFYHPKLSPKIAVTNPITWTTDSTPARRKLNKGSILFKFDKVKKGFIGAQVHEGILWAKRPPKPISLFIGSNLHVGDINLYYMNIRENAVERVKAYLEGR